MTLDEIKKKISSLQISLDFLRINEDEVIKQIGRRHYEDLLNEVLDQFMHYSQLLKKRDKK
jgi:hypothetical protein